MEINWKDFLQNLAATQQYCQQQQLNTSLLTARIFRSINIDYYGTKYFNFKWEKEFGLEVVSWNKKVLDGNFGSVESIFIDQLEYKKRR